MKFRVFARGSGRFHYIESEVAGGADLQIGWIEGEMMSYTNTGSLAPPPADRPARNIAHFLWRASPELQGSPETATVSGLLNVCQRIAQVRQMNESLTSLMMRGSGSINLSIYHSHLLWPDTGAFRTFLLYGEESRFARDVLRFFEDNGMGNWGVFTKFTQILGRFQLNLEKENWNSPCVLNVTFSG